MQLEHATVGVLLFAAPCYMLAALTYGAGAYVCRSYRESLFGGSVPRSLGLKMRELLRQHSAIGIVALLLLGTGWILLVAAIALTLIAIWAQGVAMGG